MKGVIGERGDVTDMSHWTTLYMVPLVIVDALIAATLLGMVTGACGAK
jgi:hypothetical protein